MAYAKTVFKVYAITIAITILTIIITTIGAATINQKIKNARTGDTSLVEECEKSIEEDFENIFTLEGCDAQVTNDNEIRVSYWVGRNFVINTYSMDKVLLTHLVEARDGLTLLFTFSVAVVALIVDLVVSIFAFYMITYIIMK